MDLKKSKQIQCDFIYIFVTVTLHKSITESFGLSPKQARRSLDILSAPNTGMTVTFPDIRMSLIMISRATSREQMFNTIGHKAYHATCGIIRFYGSEMCSEDAAYTMGEIMRQIVTEMSI